MVANIKHINDYNLVHRYLYGNEKAGQELYASVFPIVKGFLYSHKNAAVCGGKSVLRCTLKTCGN